MDTMDTMDTIDTNENAMGIGPHTITQVEAPVHVTIDWSKLTFGEAKNLQRTEGDPDAAAAATVALVSRLIGQPAEDLPISLMIEISKAITARLGGTAAAKN